MATKSDQEIRWLVSEMAVRMLRRSAEESQRERLKRAVRDWFPDTSDVDEFELRRITEQVAEGLAKLSTLVDQRRDRLINTGFAVEVRLRGGAA